LDVFFKTNSLFGGYGNAFLMRLDDSRVIRIKVIPLTAVFRFPGAMPSYKETKGDEENLLDSSPCLV
jgi:hypothetical protein